MTANEEIDNAWDRRACPLCGSSKLLSKPNSSAKHPAEFMSWETVYSYFIGLRSDQVFFSYYRCQDCGLLYCPWYFNPKQLSELYAEMPDNMLGEDKSTVSKTQSTYARWIMRPGVSNNRYLEVGPDIGLLAKEIAAINTPEHVTFIEPNVSIRGELLDNLNGVSSIEVFSYLDSMRETKFSLMAGIHVYDHLLNPLQDLIEIRKKAESGANIAIVVHNEKSILRYLLKSKWPPFCLQHPQLYNPKTLKLILESSNWSLCKRSKTKNWYHVKNLAHIASSVLGIKMPLIKYIPNVEIPVKLGNIIILAKAI